MTSLKSCPRDHQLCHLVIMTANDSFCLGSQEIPNATLEIHLQRNFCRTSWRVCKQVSSHLFAVGHHKHLETVAVCPDELEHGVTADVPDHQGAQAPGGGHDIAEPERVHAEQRGAGQLQVLQRCAIFLDALKNTETEINLIIL